MVTQSRLLLSLVLTLVGAPALMHCVTPNKLLVISFDGFRSDYLERGVTPNFLKFKQNGISVKRVYPVFPTFTQPCHYSISTGRHPDHHGVVGNSFFDYGLGFFFEGYNRNPQFWNYNNTEPIWITAKKNGMQSVLFFWSAGHVGYPDGQGNVYKPDMYVPKKLKKVVPWTLTVERVIERLTGGYQLAMIHNYEPDNTGHDFGPYAPEINDTLRTVDDRLRYLLEQIKIAGLEDELNIIVLADHGMEKVEKVVNIGTDYNISQTEYIPWTWGGMMFIDVRAQADRDKIYWKLKKGSPDFEVYYKEQVPAYLNFGKNPRIGQLVLIPRPGVQLRPGGDLPLIEQIIPIIANISCRTKPLLPPPIKPPVTIPPEITSIICNLTSSQAVQALMDLVNGHQTLFVGMHGYDGLAPSMAPIFMASGPDFKKGYELEKANQVDYYSLMTTLLRIKPQPNDGTFETFRSALLDPDSFSDKSAASGRHFISQFMLLFVTFILSTFVMRHT